MSTIGVSTRSSRLNSRELFTKAISKRKMRSKKIITINRSSQNVNINTKDKGLHVSKINVSANNSQPISRRLRPRPSKKNYCEDSKLLQQHIPQKQQDSIVILEKLSLENDEKVPVYKTMEPYESSLENKHDVYDFVFDINDTMEKATKKKQNKKINKKKSKMTKKTIRSKKIIIPLKIDNEENKKSGLDLIDSNAKKTNPSTKPMQSNSSKSTTELIATQSTKKDKKTIETPRIDINNHIIEESIKENTLKNIASSSQIDTKMVRELVEENTEKKIEIPRLNTNIEIVEETSLPDRAFPEQIKTQDTKKPKVISIENANNIMVIKSPPNNTEEFWPFRPKNIFDNKISVKQQNTLNCSLLTKSLSPVFKTTSTLDLESPWRPPTLSMFSQTKHFIQSTPKLKLENNKGNIEMNRENIEISKENLKINKENIKVDKENIEMNKKNTYKRKKERKKKNFKKHNVMKFSTNQTPDKFQAIDSNKHIVQAVPARISLGEIKNLLQTKPDVNDDNKQVTDQAHIHVEVDKSFTKQNDKNDKLTSFLNFSDTFDILSETERLSNIGTEVPLFVDLEPSYFSKPPQHSYKRKRTVKFDFLEDDEEEEKENVKHRTKKKKLTKSEKENEKRINEWIKSVNSTFEEIDEHNLLIE